jgi:nucleoside-diphosphate-sugar epimerase
VPGVLRGQSVLVTGSSGFVGRNLVRSLAARNEVHGLDVAEPRVEFEGVSVVRHDLPEPLPFSRLPSRIDTVFHLGALVAPCEDEPLLATAVNVVGTQRLLEYARDAGARSFVYSDTGSIYSPGTDLLREEQPIHPGSMYALTKYLGELMVEFYGRFFATTNLRYFYVYGPGTSNPLQAVVDSVRRGDAVSVPGDGRPRINPIHISDAVIATERAALLPGHNVVNVAGTEPIDRLELVHLAAKLAGREPNVVLTPAEPDGDFVASTDRMQSLLGFTPRVTLEAGFRRWVVENAV